MSIQSQIDSGPIRFFNAGSGMQDVENLPLWELDLTLLI